MLENTLLSLEWAKRKKKDVSLKREIFNPSCSHAIHYSIWSKYGALPERFNWRLKAPDVSFYPLRPELVESTYFLYQATKNPFYLHVGKEIIENLNQHAKTDCGYATIHNGAQIFLILYWYFTRIVNFQMQGVSSARSSLFSSR